MLQSRLASSAAAARPTCMSNGGRSDWRHTTNRLTDGATELSIQEVGTTFLLITRCRYVAAGALLPGIRHARRLIASNVQWMAVFSRPAVVFNCFAQLCRNSLVQPLPRSPRVFTFTLEWEVVHTCLSCCTRLLLTGLLKTRMPSCRWQTRATRNHAEKRCSSTFK